MPNVRDHDASVYLRLQGDALSVGGYEHNPIFWDDVSNNRFGVWQINYSSEFFKFSMFCRSGYMHCRVCLCCREVSLALVVHGRSWCILRCMTYTRSISFTSLLINFHGHCVYVCVFWCYLLRFTGFCFDALKALSGYKFLLAYFQYLYIWVVSSALLCGC